jgi:hypothetical protein
VRDWITNWRGRRARTAKEAVWKAELDRFGVWEVRQKLGQAGAGSFVHGFASGPIEREFVELWLSKKVQAAERQQAAILGWARIAAWASLAAALFFLPSRYDIERVRPTSEPPVREPRGRLQNKDFGAHKKERG